MELVLHSGFDVSFLLFYAASSHQGAPALSSLAMLAWIDSPVRTLGSVSTLVIVVSIVTTFRLIR